MSRSMAVAAVAAAALAGIVGMRSCAIPTDDDPRPVESPAPGSEDSGRAVEAQRPIGPTRTEHGVPQGWRRDTDGARAAVTTWLTLTGEVARAEFITRSDMIGELATEAFAPELERETEAQLQQLRDELGTADVVPSQLVWSEVPLTARVTDASLDRARVQVWSVLVFAAPGGVPRQAWHTVTVDVVWEDGDWRANGWADRPGPTPALSPTVEVSSFDELRRTAEWPAVVDSPGHDGDDIPPNNQDDQEVGS